MFDELVEGFFLGQRDRHLLDRAVLGKFLLQALRAAVVGAGHLGDPSVDLIFADLDVLGLDDLAKDERQPQFAAGLIGGVGLQFGEILADLLARHAALEQLDISPLQRPFGVAGDNAFGQVEVRRVEQVLADLVVHRLLDVAGQPGGHFAGEELPHFLERLEPGRFGERIVHLGQRPPLDLGDRQGDGQVLVGPLLVGMGRRGLGGQVGFVAGLLAGQGIAQVHQREALNLPRPDAQGQSRAVHRVAVLAGDVGVDQHHIAGGGGSIGGGVGGPALAKTVDVGIDPFVGDLEHGLVDLDSGQFGQVELGGDLHLEAVRQIAGLGQFDILKGQIGLA